MGYLNNADNNRETLIYMIFLHWSVNLLHRITKSVLSTSISITWWQDNFAVDREFPHK